MENGGFLRVFYIIFDFRQGWVLAPIIFAVYMSDIVSRRGSQEVVYKHSVTFIHANEIITVSKSFQEPLELGSLPVTVACSY